MLFHARGPIHNRMRNLRLVLLLAVAACAFREDDSERLARQLQAGASALRNSASDEIVVRYVPAEGMAQPYEVHLGRSESTATPFDHEGRLYVTSSRAGSTTMHRHFVLVPRELHIARSNAPVEVVLRKNGNHVEVVALR